jgi:hypothetical protein
VKFGEFSRRSIGTGAFGAFRRASGGTPTPPFAFPEDEMLLGMGLTGLSSYFGYYPLANVLWNADRWQRQSGSGDWAQEWGTLTAATSTDTFYTKFGEGAGKAELPAGTYTVFNPDGLNIGVGWGGTPNLTGWTTATEFTFTMTGAAVIALYAEGSVTNINGPIQIIMPGRRDAFLAGNYWNPDFLTFIEALNVPCLRFMDWLDTYPDMTEEWSEVPTGLPIMFSAPITKLYAKVPYSLIVDLSNRLNINPWINVPVRASADFQEQLATYLQANLNPGLYVYLEFGNETWNFGAPFNDARAWTELYDFTRYEATPNIGISGWTRAAHGLSTGDIIASFATKENFTKLGYEQGMVYPLGFGVGLYVESVDANNFKLYEDVGRTIPYPPDPSDMSAGAIAKRNNYATIVKMIYKKRVEAGKVASVDANTGKQSLAMWDRMNAILGRGRCVNVLGSQLATPAVTAARLLPAGVKAATDTVALAPYYSGDWWVGAVDIASGQLTPKAWSHNANDVEGNGNNISVRIAVYAAGSTPRTDQLVAGTGVGYIAHRDIPITTQDRNAYTTGSAITGLSNGTDYEVFTIFSGMYGDKWVATDTVTVSATTSTVTMRDSNEAMADRFRRRITSRSSTILPQQITAADGVPISCYEAGSDMIAAFASTPADVVALRTDFSQSAEAAEVLDYFYRYIASYGLVQANQFTDVNPASPGVFSIAESFTDTSDPRVIAFAAFNGAVPDGTPPTVSNVTATAIATEPSYPAVAYTFADPALTYKIFNGDPNGNFDIVGDELRLVNGDGITWSTVDDRTLVIEASNGLSSYFNLAIDVGTLAAGGVAAPTLTGTPTLLASWDFADDSTITNVSGRVSAISGADGTSYSLSGPGGTANPDITTAGGKQVAAFASANSQKLSGAHISGVSGACTFVAVLKMDSVAASSTLFETAEPGASSSTNRLQLLMSSSGGFQARQHDSAGTQSIAAVGSPPNTTDTHLVIGAFPNATATAALLNVNGQGSATTGSPTSNAAASMTLTSVGVRRVGGTDGLFANMKLFRVLIYSGALTSTQKEEIATWAASNYGTANNA